MDEFELTVEPFMQSDDRLHAVSPTPIPIPIPAPTTNTTTGPVATSTIPNNQPTIVTGSTTMSTTTLPNSSPTVTTPPATATSTSTATRPRITILRTPKSTTATVASATSDTQTLQGPTFMTPHQAIQVEEEKKSPPPAATAQPMIELASIQPTQPTATAASSSPPPYIPASSPLSTSSRPAFTLRPSTNTLAQQTPAAFALNRLPSTPLQRFDPFQLDETEEDDVIAGLPLPASTDQPPVHTRMTSIVVPSGPSHPAPKLTRKTTDIIDESHSAPLEPTPHSPPPPGTKLTGGVRSVFELTELDMLRLRPFIHGVHVKVNKKRTKWIFGPETMFRRCWCALRAIFIMTFMILIPLRACFTVRTNIFPITLIFDYLIDIFFFLDFLAWNFVFSVNDYSQGVENQLIYRPKEISRNYRKWGGYRYDLIATIPFDYVFIPLQWWRVILWVRLLKLARIPNLLHSITSVNPQFIRNQIDPVVKRMVVVFLAIYMCIHWAACGWNLLRHGLALHQSDDPSYTELANQYVVSLYFIQTCVVTLGYGDIVPETTGEVLFVTVVMIFGFVAQAALVGHLITLLKHRLGKRAWYRASLLQLKQYCLIHDLSPAVTRRLFHYYHYLWARQKGLDEHQLLLNDFPPIYLADFGVELTLDILSNIPFMCQDACPPPVGFVRALVPYMYPETFCPSITILQQGVSNTRLFLIVHGQVEQILDDIDGNDFNANLFKPVTTILPTDIAAAEAGLKSSLADKPIGSGVRSKPLSAGMFFGHDSFLVPFNSIPYTYISTSYVDLFSIESQHFRHCLSSYPDFEVKVNQYVETIYASNEQLKPSERAITINSNVSARMRRIRREVHINKMKRVFAARQKSRHPSMTNPTRFGAPPLSRKSTGRGMSSKRAMKNQEDDVSVVKPHSVLHIALQTLSFICFFYFMISLPLRIGYMHGWVQPSTFVQHLLLDYIIDLWFWCEMVLRMWKIALIDELNPHDPLLTDARLILHTYIHSYAFVLDLLSLIPFDLIPLFVSYERSDYTQIHITYVCLVRLRVFFRFHRFFQYFQSATFALTLLFDKSGLVELNSQTGGFGGADAEADQTMATGGANDLLDMDGTSSSESEEELPVSDTNSVTDENGHKLSRRKSTAGAAVGVDSAPLGSSSCANCLARLNTPHAILSHSYHTRTALLVLRLLLVIGFFIHLSSCFFFYVARVESVPEGAINPDGSSNDMHPRTTMIDNTCSGALCGKSITYSAEQSYNWAWRAHVWDNLANSAEQYMLSLLWALETLTVIGFGSITPITSPEYLYTFFFTFIGSTLYLVMLGFLTVLVDSAFQNSHSFEQSITCADHFIQKQNLPTTLRLRIHTFYHYLWFLQSGKRDENFLENLPSHLRLDVVSYLTLPIVTAIPLFSNIELGALEKILLCLCPVSAGPMDVLLMQGEVSNKVVLIQKGSVDVSINAAETVDEDGHNTSDKDPFCHGVTLPALKSGNYFNERCLLMLGPSSANYVALSFCHLFTLSKRDFDHAIINYQHFKATVRDRRERVKAQEKEKLERMRKKVERLEKERAAKFVVVESSRSNHQKQSSRSQMNMPPPPPPSPPTIPTPSPSDLLPNMIRQSSTIPSVIASPSPSSALSIAIPNPDDPHTTPDRQLAKALKKQKQVEKMQKLREEKKSTPTTGLSRRTSHRRSHTGAGATRSTETSPRHRDRGSIGGVSSGDVVELMRSKSIITSSHTKHRRARASMADSLALLQQLTDAASSSDSDAEDTRASMMELTRRNTQLSRGGEGSTTPSSPRSTVRNLSLAPSTPGQGFRDLERNVTRRLHGNMSVKTFLNTAERDANEDVFAVGTGAETPRKLPQDADAIADAALQKQQEEEMNQALMAMSGDVAIIDIPTETLPLETNNVDGDSTNAPTKGLGLWASTTTAGVSESFAPQTINRAPTRSNTVMVLSQQFGARLFYYIFCCHTTVYSCFSWCGSKKGQPFRLFPPTSLFRVLWNIVSMFIVFYYLLIVPFRLCIGLFPTDSCIGAHGMDDHGHISHLVPGSIMYTGMDYQFDGLILWYGSAVERSTIQVAMWILDLIFTIFWVADIVLRCKCFPLFIHHSDGLSGMKKPSTAAGTPGSDARAVQQALHDASGHSSTGGIGLNLANAVALAKAKRAFMGVRAGGAPNLLSSQHQPLQRTHTIEKQHLSANRMLHVTDRPETVIVDAGVTPVVPTTPSSTSKHKRLPTATSSFKPIPMDVSTTIFESYYMSGSLKWDLLGTIPFDLIFGLWYPELASILRIARLARVHRIFQYIHGFENFIEFYAVRINTVVLRIIEQFFILIFTIHIFGCLWFLIGRIGFVYWGIASTAANTPIFSTVRNQTVFEPLQVNTPPQFDNTHGWLSEEAFTPVYANDRTVRNLYLASVYFVLTCISTTGFGDIVPHTTIEILFVSMLILMGCVVYSFVTANIASLAANLDVSAEAFGEKLDDIKRFMAARKLPLPLQKKIYHYYREQWNLSKGYEEDNLLDEIPHYLKQAFVYTMHEGLIHHHVLFRGLEENFLIHLSMALKYVMVIAGQVILQKGEVNLDMFLIRKGCVHIIMDNGGILDELSEGGSFNEGALFHMEEIMKHEEQKQRRLQKEVQRKGNAPKRMKVKMQSIHSLAEIKEESQLRSNSKSQTMQHSKSPSVSQMDSNEQATLANLVTPPQPTPDHPHPAHLPTIRQLYSVVAVSHSVDLYTLHQRTVEAMCRLYPVSSDELKKRWKEKTTEQVKETATDATKGQGDGGSDSDSDHMDTIEDESSNDATAENSQTGFEPVNESPPTLPANHTHEASPTINLHVHQHSHAVYDGITTLNTKTHADLDPLVHSIRGKQPLLLHQNTFTAGSGVSARFLHQTSPVVARDVISDPYNSSYDDESVQRERGRLATALFNFGFVWRDGSMERLRWNIISLFALLVHCWVIPIFIAFTQIRVLTTVGLNSSMIEFENDHTVFWAFLAIAFTVDIFFIVDWYMMVRHFATERELDGVHWKHYVTAEFMKKKLNELISQNHVSEFEVKRNSTFKPFGNTLDSCEPPISQSKRLSNKVSEAAIGIPVLDTSITEISNGTDSQGENPLSSIKVAKTLPPDGRDSSGSGTATPIETIPAHLNPQTYSSLSTLPFHVDAFPASSAEVTYAYFHQPGAWYRIPFDLLAICPMAAIALLIMLGTERNSIDFTIIAILSLNRVLLLLRVVPYLTSLDSYLDRVDHMHVSFQTRRIIKYSILILFIVHWVSCGWLLFGTTGNTPDQIAHDISLGEQSTASVTWMMLMKEGRVQQMSQWYQYLFSVYWSITVVTTTGFGDITPTNPGEVIFCMIVILVGNVIYGCIIGAVTTSTANASANIAFHFEQLSSLNHWMNHRHVSPELMEKTLAYHKHLWRTHHGVNDAAVINRLPILLRKEVCYTLYGGYLAQVPFFPSHDVSFLANLSILLHPQLYLAGDLLMRKDDIGSEMMMLRSGRVRVFIYDPEEAGGSLRKKITLQATMWLGENAFFEQSLRTASVRALTHCDVLVLANDDFQAMLVNYPHYRYTIYERFLKHAEKNYTDKKPVANATFLDFSKIIADEKPAPVAPIPLSFPVESTPVISIDSASGTPASIQPDGALSPTKKTYTLALRKPPVTDAPPKAASAPPDVATSTTLPQSSLVVNIPPPDTATSSSSAAPNSASSPSNSNISFANLVKLLATAGTSLTSPQLQPPQPHGHHHHGPGRDRHTAKPNFNRKDTFARMMNS